MLSRLIFQPSFYSKFASIATFGTKHVREPFFKGHSTLKGLLASQNLHKSETCLLDYSQNFLQNYKYIHKNVTKI
jgi:hypothetical protein